MPLAVPAAGGGAPRCARSPTTAAARTRTAIRLRFMRGIFAQTEDVRRCFVASDDATVVVFRHGPRRCACEEILAMAGKSNEMQDLNELPGRVAALESQFQQFRDDVRAEFSATRDGLRGEIRAGDEETRRSLREEIRAGDEATRRLMLELHDQAVTLTHDLHDKALTL